MANAFYQANDATFYVGDCLSVLKSMPEASVQCVVTSPPYFQLRSYLSSEHAHQHLEMGSESTIGEFIGNLVGVFREVMRVLRDDGTLWLVIGDSYAGSGKGPTGHNWQGDQSKRQGFTCGNPSRELAPKNLMMVPARLAIALQDDGWILRSDIIWHKRAPMPESVTDRPTGAHEHIFLLAKSARYYYDANGVREESVSDHGSGNGFKRPARLTYGGRGNDTPWEPTASRNLRNVWTLGPESNAAAHFATFPTEIPRRAILAGTKEGDTVLDPFGGSGTTAIVARQLGRQSIYIDLNEDYANIAIKRLEAQTPSLLSLQEAASG